MALKRESAPSAAALRKRAAESDDGMMSPDVDLDRRQILGGTVGVGEGTAAPAIPPQPTSDLQQAEIIPPSPSPIRPQPPVSAAPVIDHGSSEVVGLTAEAVLETVNRLWRSSMDNFVRIGMELNRANAVWRDPDEFKARILDRLPFGEKVASQLKAVARAVDQKLLSSDELPNGYSTAYQLTTLTREELSEARRRGLLDRDLTRSKIIEFKRSFRGRMRTDASNLTDRMAAYDHAKKKRDDLVQKKADLERELLTLDAAIKEAEQAMLEIMGQ